MIISWQQHFENKSISTLEWAMPVSMTVAKVPPPNGGLPIIFSSACEALRRLDERRINVALISVA
jgi:hypothetical protein